MTAIIFTGKGGVGKTTCAAATAVQLAKGGARVLIASSDAAHSLGDCLMSRIGGQPAQIFGSLHAMEIDARMEMRSRFGEVRDTMLANMEASGLDSALAAEMIEFPGAEELFAMLRLAEVRAANTYDFVVLDCAPTGNTLRFLNFSEFLSPIQRALKIERAYNRITGPLAKLVGKKPLSKESYYDAIFQTFSDIEDARTSMLDDDTRFRVVLNPERLAIIESQRAVSFLNVAGFFVDAIIANRVLSAEITDPFFGHWKTAHQRYLTDIREQFQPIRVLEVPLCEREVAGIDDLARLGETLYPGIDAGQKLTAERPFELERNGSSYQLRFRIPALDRAELVLETTDAGLFVKIGHFERRIQLPTALADAAVSSAKYDQRFLTLEFATAGAN